MEFWQKKDETATQKDTSKYKSYRWITLFRPQKREVVFFAGCKVVYLLPKAQIIMEQIYIDSLNALMVYKYDLDAVVLELERVEHQNTILYCVLGGLVVLSLFAAFFLLRRHNKVLNSEKLANRLLTRQAENLPLFTDKVNKISSKSIKLSGELYDELQSAISMVKANSKSSMVEVVNDGMFVKMYPFIQDFEFLTPQEKLILILTEEGYSIAEIALFIGTSDASVRAIKSRIRTKLTQSGSVGGSYKKLKILKKN